MMAAFVRVICVSLLVGGVVMAAYDSLLALVAGYSMLFSGGYAWGKWGHEDQ